MSTFDSTKTQLGVLLQHVVDGSLQLPDFQRGWVWDDEHIRALLVSVARSFPIGAVMLLETGGETLLKTRPVEGVELPARGKAPKELILDGQQRLTSLTQVLKLKKPVLTKDAKKRDLLVHYYFNIDKALEGPASLADAIVAVGEDRTLRSDFGRRVDLDLSTRAKELETFHFPCSQILDSADWEYSLMDARDRFPRFMEFRQRVLEPFRNYMLPVISLKRETSKEAVCLVFEKVNTGGVPLSVFELITATWAADGFNLREDWLGERGNAGRHGRLRRRPLLQEVQPTDFLQGISLLHSSEKRAEHLREGRSGKDVAAVTAKREHILELPLAAYEKWAEPLTRGLEEAECFLRNERFHHPRFLPYRTQLTPLAVLLTRLGERWMEPRIKDKLARWFWCGVFGELYGSTIETRIALDVQQVSEWIDREDASEPATIQAASFNPNRLDTLRSRTSAAYRGLYVLLQREGAKDFFWKSRMIDLDRDERNIDIHHIFPKQWCIERDIPQRTFDSIVNKTAISYKANRMIGGQAPSKYLSQLQSHSQVESNDAEMDAILGTHLIEPRLLRSDDFERFYAARRAALLQLVERTMGKAVGVSAERAEEDDDDDDADGEPR